MPIERNRRLMDGPVSNIPNRRQYSRVDVYIPMECRLVNEEEKGLAKSRVSIEVTLADFKLLPPVENHPQIEYLNLLNNKLDRIIHVMSLQYKGFHSLPFNFVSLSAQGMKFSSQQQFSLGDIIEFRIILTLNQPTALYVYGEVIRLGGQKNAYFVNVRFTEINDAIRDKIIQFVFETERTLLRERTREI
jgi:hypothetical protein